MFPIALSYQDNVLNPKIVDVLSGLEDRLYDVVREHLEDQGEIEPAVFIDIGQPVFKVAIENNNTVVSINFIKE